MTLMRKTSLLVVFDVAAAVLVFVIGLNAISGGSVRLDWVLALNIADVALAAVIVSPWYVHATVRHSRRFRRSVVFGPLFGLLVCALYGTLLSLEEFPTSRSPGDFAGIIVVITLVGSPFIVLGGLVFGALHAWVAERTTV